MLNVRKHLAMKLYMNYLPILGLLIKNFNFLKLQKGIYQRKWLDEFKWLVYSDVLKGALCKYCTLFARKGVGKGSHVNTVALASIGYHKWKLALAQFRDHSNHQYHKNAVESAENFVSIYKKKAKILWNN